MEAGRTVKITDSITTPKGLTFEYGYNTINQLSSVNWGGVYTTHYRYNSSGCAAGWSGK